jgi:hypothetical protein
MGRTTHTAVLKDSKGGDVVIAPTVLPNSRSWLRFGADSTQEGLHEERFLTPRELLMLQGWPMSGRPSTSVTFFPESLQVDLAGNMFSGTVTLSLIASLLCVTHWKESRFTAEVPVTSMVDCDAACLLMGKLMG